jgi:hypothetical protein
MGVSTPGIFDQVNLTPQYKKKLFLLKEFLGRKVLEVCDRTIKLVIVYNNFSY